MPFENNEQKVGTVLLCKCSNCITFTCSKNESGGCFTHVLNIRHKTFKNSINVYYVMGFLLLLLFLSATGFYLMWCTEFYNNTLLSKLVLANNSETAKNWMNPNPKFDTLLKVHIFNYTNIDRYLSGKDSKLNIEDIGPLTYREHTVKAEVSFNKNFTVSFRDKKSFIFLPQHSKLKELDNIVVPNVPLLTAVSKIEKMSYWRKFASSKFIRVYNAPLFKELNAQQYLWGYKDNIAGSTGPNMFGLLRLRNGISVDSVQFNTGEDDLKKYSILTQFNGMPELNFWEGDYCNQIDGSDATRFPPHLLKNHEDLHVFLQVLCRKIPLKYDGKVTLYDNIDALRYRTPINIFAHPSVNPNNECFCKNTKRCLPSGIINATLCYAEVPIYPSLPHFFTGDPILFEHMDGLNPEASKHQTYADLHPRFAFPIGGASRIQINILQTKSNIYTERKFQLNELYLPLIWIEITSGDMTPEMLDDLYMSTVGLNATENALKYGTLFTCLLCIAALALTLVYLQHLYQEHVMESVLQSSDEEIEVVYPRIHNVF